jgi:hypothetical protein
MCSRVLVLVTKSTEAEGSPVGARVQRRQVADAETPLELFHRCDRPAWFAQAPLGGEAPEPLEARVHEIDVDIWSEVDEDLPLDAERPEGKWHSEIPPRAELVEEGFRHGSLGPVLSLYAWTWRSARLNRRRKLASGPGREWVTWRCRR